LDNNGRPLLYEALIAEDRSYGERIFLRAQSDCNIEHALRTLFHSTNEQVKKVTMEIPVESLEIKPLNQDDTNAESHENGSGMNTKESNKSPEEKEMERFHNALGHVLDLASKNRVTESEAEIEN
jgi:hypothetical protein